jgi:hypothetical protein
MLPATGGRPTCVTESSAHAEPLVPGPSSPPPPAPHAAVIPHYQESKPLHRGLHDLSKSTSFSPSSHSKGNAPITSADTHPKHHMHAANACANAADAQGGTSSIAMSQSAATSFYSAVPSLTTPQHLGAVREGTVPQQAQQQHAVMHQAQQTQTSCAPASGAGVRHRTPFAAIITNSGDKQLMIRAPHIQESVARSDPVVVHACAENPVQNSQPKCAVVTHVPCDLTSPEALQQLNPADLHEALAALVDTPSPPAEAPDMQSACISGEPQLCAAATNRLSSANLRRDSHRRKAVPPRGELPASPRTASQRILQKLPEASSTFQRKVRNSQFPLQGKRDKAPSAAPGVTPQLNSESQQLLRTFLEASVLSVKPGVDMNERSRQRDVELAHEKEGQANERHAKEHGGAQGVLTFQCCSFQNILVLRLKNHLFQRSLGIVESVFRSAFYKDGRAPQFAVIQHSNRLNRSLMQDTSLKETVSNSALRPSHLHEHRSPQTSLLSSDPHILHSHRQQSNQSSQEHLCFPTRQLLSAISPQAPQNLLILQHRTHRVTVQPV